MTIDDFTTLDEHKKVELIFDANKIAEKSDGEIMYQLFQIDNFYVEAKTSVKHEFKRTFTTYTLQNLPPAYAVEIISISLVKADEEPKVVSFNKHTVKSKRMVV